MIIQLLPLVLILCWLQSQAITFIIGVFLGIMLAKRMSPLPLWNLNILMDTQEKILQD